MSKKKSFKEIYELLLCCIHSRPGPHAALVLRVGCPWKPWMTEPLETNPSLPRAPDFHLGHLYGSREDDSTLNLRAELLTGPEVGKCWSFSEPWEFC